VIIEVTFPEVHCGSLALKRFFFFFFFIFHFSFFIFHFSFFIFHFSFFIFHTGTNKIKDKTLHCISFLLYHTENKT